MSSIGPIFITRTRSQALNSVGIHMTLALKVRMPPEEMKILPCNGSLTSSSNKQQTVFNPYCS